MRVFLAFGFGCYLTWEFSANTVACAEHPPALGGSAAGNVSV